MEADHFWRPTSAWCTFSEMPRQVQFSPIDIFSKSFQKITFFYFWGWLRLSLTSLFCGVNYPSKGALNPVVKILKLVYTLELWHLFFKTLRPLYSKMEAAIQKRPMPSKSHMPGLSEMVRQPMIGSIKVPIWSVWKKFDFLVYFDHKLWASISGGWGQFWWPKSISSY